MPRVEQTIVQQLSTTTRSGYKVKSMLSSGTLLTNPLAVCLIIPGNDQPLQVNVSIQARVPSSSGRQGEGTPFFSSATPLQWALGCGQIGGLLEEGISAMAKGEHAFISCPDDKGGKLIPQPPEGVDRVEYEVELHSMIQVRLDTSGILHGG